MAFEFSATAGVAGTDTVSGTFPVDVRVAPALGHRNRLTVAFRFLLAIPHLVLVGGPAAFAFSFFWHAEGPHSEWGAGVGLLGGVAAMIALIAWFAIVFGARFPRGLWALSAFYLRWRVRSVAYVTMLRDEYPPFGDGAYPAELTLPEPAEPRDRLTVALRPLLALPHLVVLWVLGVAWLIATLIAWIAILVTGRFPAILFHFGVSMLRWSARVEAYLLLLRDEYPPFTLE